MRCLFGKMDVHLELIIKNFLNFNSIANFFKFLDDIELVSCIIKKHVFDINKVKNDWRLKI